MTYVHDAGNLGRAAMTIYLAITECDACGRQTEELHTQRSEDDPRGKHAARLCESCFTQGERARAARREEAL